MLPAPASSPTTRGAAPGGDFRGRPAARGIGPLIATVRSVMTSVEVHDAPWRRARSTVAAAAPAMTLRLSEAVNSKCRLSWRASGKDCRMDRSIISAVAALAGAAVGGLMSGIADWINHRSQVRAQWLNHEKSRRQILYKDFIEEASKCYIDALQHDEADIRSE